MSRVRRSRWEHPAVDSLGGCQMCSKRDDPCGINGQEAAGPKWSRVSRVRWKRQAVPLGVPHVWHVCTQTCGMDLKSAIACWASTLGVCFARCEVSGSSSVASLIKVRLAVGASWRKSPRWITMGMQPRRGGAARRKTRKRCGCYCDDSQPDSPACCTSKVRRC